MHRESTTEILVACSGGDGSGSAAKMSQEVFINPIQEFNRDLSVLALQTWSNLLAAEKQKKSSAKRERASKKRKHEEIEEANPAAAVNGETSVSC